MRGSRDRFFHRNPCQQRLPPLVGRHFQKGAAHLFRDRPGDLRVRRYGMGREFAREVKNSQGIPNRLFLLLKRLLHPTPGIGKSLDDMKIHRVMGLYVQGRNLHLEFPGEVRPYHHGRPDGVGRGKGNRLPVQLGRAFYRALPGEHQDAAQVAGVAYQREVTPGAAWFKQMIRIHVGEVVPPLEEFLLECRYRGHAGQLEGKAGTPSQFAQNRLPYGVQLPLVVLGDNAESIAFRRVGGRRSSCKQSDGDPETQQRAAPSFHLSPHCTGSAAVKVVPFPGSLSTSIQPPFASARFLQTTSPSPIPLGLVVKRGWNSLLMFS